ncbi:MAG: hypothetical protein IPK97_19945 [Ahniella sp.]|nr:hypothetical protein [Ahniella sp.]
MRGLPIFLSLLMCAVSAVSAVSADDYADKFFAKVEAEALRDLDRDKPEKKIEAASRLGPQHAAQVATALAPLLAHAKAEIRLGAANALWDMAGKNGDIVNARAALNAALDDVDSEVAMNAAGALASMGVEESELAPSRLRVLQGRPQSRYVEFLAARGLIGLEPSANLMPYLLAYYFDAVEAEAQGGSDDNVELAENAIEGLVSHNDAATVPILVESLRVTPAATEFLLEQLARFDPLPADWTGLLLGFTDAGYQDTRETAFELLGKQKDPASMARWVPKAVPLLGDARLRRAGLRAMSDVAGRTTLGLEELAALTRDASALEEDRLRAVEIIVAGADTSNRDGSAEVQKAARAVWWTLCDPIIRAEKPGQPWFKACNPTSYWIIADEAERAKTLGDWLTANQNVEAKVHFLQSLEGMWSKALPAAGQIRAERSHADPSVVAAAESALNRIEPAWRERDARAAAPAKPAPPAGPEAPATGKSGKGADGASLFAAISSGDVAAVKRLVTSSNVHMPVQYAQISNAPVPIQIAINYCGIPQAAAGLPAVVTYLMSLGANPDITTPMGDALLDHAKYACPPEIMALLVQ